MAGLGGCSLLLVSRRGPQAPGARELAAELTAAGTPARVVAADVTDRAAMAGLVAEAARDGAPVRAVFHTAGVPGRRRVLETGPEDLRTVLAAKAEGARVLDAVLEGTDVDAFVLFSSVSGVWGAAGQAAYGAANAALDALAARRRARGGRPSPSRGAPGPAAAWWTPGWRGTCGGADWCRWPSPTPCGHWRSACPRAPTVCWWTPCGPGSCPCSPRPAPRRCSRTSPPGCARRRPNRRRHATPRRRPAVRGTCCTSSGPRSPPSSDTRTPAPWTPNGRCGSWASTP
ncbi:ketoreductase domain-containing protein [Streptomyces albus]